MKLYTLVLSTAIFLRYFGNSHSWIETLVVVTPTNNLNYSHPAGYPRGYVPRTSPSFLKYSDKVMTYHLPPDGRSEGAISKLDPICMPSQQTYNYTERYVPLYVPIAGNISLQYQENGHVTKPHVPSAHKTPGMTYVYGTNQSEAEDKLLDIFQVWNWGGSGGDRRGRLIGESPFDDGECYQANPNPPPNPPNLIYEERKQDFGPDPFHGDNRWCQSVVSIPADVGVGRYTLYWVWNDSTDDTTSIYTTCMDIIIEG